jgi:hypothetical protein
MDRRIEEAWEAIGLPDWESLRLMLHPYVRWSDGGTSIRGRTKVMAHLRAHPVADRPARGSFVTGRSTAGRCDGRGGWRPAALGPAAG